MHQNETIDKIHKLFDMARKDIKYVDLTRKYLAYEAAFNDLARDMAEEDQNILLGMSWYIR